MEQAHCHVAGRKESTERGEEIVARSQEKKSRLEKQRTSPSKKKSPDRAAQENLVKVKEGEPRLKRKKNERKKKKKKNEKPAQHTCRSIPDHSARKKNTRIGKKKSSHSDF